MTFSRAGLSGVGDTSGWVTGCELMPVWLGIDRLRWRNRGEDNNNSLTLTLTYTEQKECGMF